MAVNKGSAVKSFLAGAISAAVLLGLSACNFGLKPSDRVEAELEKIKTQEISDELINVFGDNEKLKKKYSESYKKMLSKVQEFEYKVKDEKISDDKQSAVVVIEIKTYDFGAAYKDSSEQVLKAAADGKIDGDTDVEDYVYGLLLKNMDALGRKSSVRDVEVKCSRNKSGDWVTDIQDNQAMQDAIMGGYLTAANDVSGTKNK